VESLLLNLRGDVANLTEQLINVASVSGDEKSLADAVESALRDCSWLEVTRLSNTIIARTNLGRPQRVILAGHLDTVPAAENQQAVRIAADGTLPTGETAEQEVIFGLGSCDMKAGVAVALHAAATISEPSLDVTYVFYECEEVESARNGLTLVAASQPDLLKADVAVLLEPSNAAIEAGCQGTLRAEVTAKGVRAHSARSWKGSNAIHSLTAALDLLQNFVADQVEVDGLVYREGLNAVGIKGGIAGNVIPDSATVVINYRYAPTVSAEAAQHRITEFFADYEVTILDNEPGALPGLTDPAVAKLVALVDGKVAPKFGWTDVSRFAKLGIPAVNLGPGDPQFAHSASEHVPVADIEQTAQIIQQWLTQ